MAQSQIKRSYTYSKKWKAEPSIEEEVNLTGITRTFNIGSKKDVEGEGISYFPIYETTGGEDETGKHAEYIGVYEFPTQSDAVLEAAGIIDDEGDPTIVYDSGEAVGTFKNPHFATAFTEFTKSPTASEKAAEERETAAAIAAVAAAEKAAAEKAAATEAAREKRAQEWKRQKEAEEAEKAAATEAAKRKDKTPSSKLTHAPATTHSSWIAQYFNNGNYRIDHSIPGDGNCFFFTIGRALRSTLSPQQARRIPDIVQAALKKVVPGDQYANVISKVIPSITQRLTSGGDESTAEYNEFPTVAALRFLVSEVLCTEASLRELRSSYLMALNGDPTVPNDRGAIGGLEEYKEMRRQEINRMQKKLNPRSTPQALEKHTNELQRLINQMDMNVDTYMSQVMGMAELVPFKDITTIEQYKNYIRGSTYYASTQAIGILEYYLNIKVVIFEQDKWDAARRAGKTLSFSNRADDTVLLCGPTQLPQELQDSGGFNPSHYILVNWVGVHYELITYNGQSLFTWNELPRHLQELIVRHCGSTSPARSAFKFIRDVLTNNINGPLSTLSTAGPSTATGPQVDPPELEQLTNMGFERNDALKALAQTKDVESAIALLLGDQSIGGKKTRRRKSYKRKTKKKRHRVKKNLQKKERKTRVRKVKSRSTKKKN